MMPESDTYVGLGPSFEKYGKVLDVGLGGLAFEYLVGARHFPDEEATEVDFCIRERDFTLRAVPCHIVYDRAVQSAGKSDSHMRRCGVAFGRLSTEQREGLNEFLTRHVVPMSGQAAA